MLIDSFIYIEYYKYKENIEVVALGCLNLYLEKSIQFIPRQKTTGLPGDHWCTQPSIESNLHLRIQPGSMVAVIKGEPQTKNRTFAVAAFYPYSASMAFDYFRANI